MNALITGSSGTVGSVLAQQVRVLGGSAVGWDRHMAPPGNWDAARHLVETVRPSVIFHTAVPSRPSGMENEGWIVNEKWTADLAALARDHDVPFVYTSTVMVFTNAMEGPLTPDKEPDETTGYGFGKLCGERAARAANPNVRIARLGWQIGQSAGSNNMIDFLEREFATSGAVHASTRWLPATSFLEDTADALIEISTLAPGHYHVGSNDQWSFHEIVCALNKIHGNRWKVVATEDFVCDQRLMDPRLRLRPIADRLPGLVDHRT
jgi:dTDP-4-dehydrorhamnose reductase